MKGKKTLSQVCLLYFLCELCVFCVCVVYMMGLEDIACHRRCVDIPAPSNIIMPRRLFGGQGRGNYIRANYESMCVGFCEFNPGHSLDTHHPHAKNGVCPFVKYYHRKNAHAFTRSSPFLCINPSINQWHTHHASAILCVRIGVCPSLHISRTQWPQSSTKE